MKNTYLILLSVLFLLSSCSNSTEKLSLEGDWSVALDSADIGIAEHWYRKDFNEKIKLPGTTDAAQLGVKNELAPSLEKPQILHLTRKYAYVGPAWYSKEVDIPSDWEGQDITLNLERVLWHSSVWIDDTQVNQEQESLIAPHRYDLTNYLTPGKHKLTIRIDNRKQYDISVNDLAHAYTNDTQIMWNGILGDISLTANPGLKVAGLQVYPKLSDNSIHVETELLNNGKTTEGELVVQILEHPSNKSVFKEVKKVSLKEGTQKLSFDSKPTELLKEWNEFTPELYTLDLTLTAGEASNNKQVKFGMREIKTDANKILVNNRPTFLRGTLECCIFPLTGHPPMEKEGWEKVFVTAKEWGLNHIRFHSWCPPKAAFEVADSLGVYLQVELPLWSLTVGKNENTNKFLYAEADKIIEEYGNHPSFCFFSLGNELQPDFDFMAELLGYVKDQDNRHLYTTTSYTFEPGHGIWPEALDDFFITQRTKKGWVRGQGVFDSESPSFDKDYYQSVEGMPVPLITHEIGQYAVYPNLKEIDKYTGVLDPLNFKGVKEDLKVKGLLDKANDYLMGSGKLAELLYKEEIERAIKTDGCSGIQLLDLHDFPGQGTALVGLLDAFWESKGITTADKFSQFCSPIVPLAYFPKATYKNNESFEFQAAVANYSADELKGESMHWTFKDEANKTVAEGELNIDRLALGVSKLPEKVQVSLENIKEAGKYTLTLALNGTDYTNGWNIWVYPAELNPEKEDVVVTSVYAQAEQALEAGSKVLFIPDYKKVKGLEGKFVPVFWSPVHFPNQAGSMGVLCDNLNPAFNHFPTDNHTNWQWWSLVKNSRTLLLDNISPVTPLVEVIDNFKNNRKLANVIETNVGNGKLVLSSIDLTSDWENRPEAKQFYYSLLEYMKSNDFNPTTSVPFSEIVKLTTND